MGAKKYLELTSDDQKKVSEIIKKGGEGRIIPRAIVLKMKNMNFTNIEAAEVAGLTPRTVINICHYYEENGLNSALNDNPRPGQPLKFDDRVKSQIVAMVCSDPPEGFDRWSLELIKEKVEDKGIVDRIGKETIRLILKEHDLSPWKYKMWCVPFIDNIYKEKMDAILDIYECSYNGKEPVICVDEKLVTLFGEKREKILFSKGKPNRIDYEYVRNGTANVFCAVEPLKGVYLNEVTNRRTKDDFAFFLKYIYDTYKYTHKIHLVMDNLNIHFQSSLIGVFGKQDGNKIWNKFQVYYTPTHASWLNQAEIAIGMYTRQCLGQTRIDSIEKLKKKTDSWNRIINKKNTTINWQFTKKKAEEKFGLG